MGLCFAPLHSPGTGTHTRLVIIAENPCMEVVVARIKARKNRSKVMDFVQ